MGGRLGKYPVLAWSERRLAHLARAARQAPRRFVVAGLMLGIGVALLVFALAGWETPDSAARDSAVLPQNGLSVAAADRDEAENARSIPQVMALKLERPAPAAEPESARDVQSEMGDAAAWLQEQDSSTYTIQLIGARRMEALDALQRDHELAEDRTIRFRVAYEGEPWHVLVYGVYESRDSAEQALRELPQALRDQGAWIRRLDGVQDLIRRGRIDRS